MADPAPSDGPKPAPTSGGLGAALAAILRGTLGATGRATLHMLGAVGRATLFALSALSHILRPPFYGRELAVALLNIGWLSLPVVALTAVFTGAALAL